MKQTRKRIRKNRAPKAVLRVIEAARRLKVTDTHIIGLIECGELLAINVGTGSRNHWRIPFEGLEQYVKRRSSLNVEVNR